MCLCLEFSSYDTANMRLKFSQPRLRIQLCGTLLCDEHTEMDNNRQSQLSSLCILYGVNATFLDSTRSHNQENKTLALFTKYFGVLRKKFQCTETCTLTTDFAARVYTYLYSCRKNRCQNIRKITNGDILNTP